MHKRAFGNRAPTGPAGEAPPDSLAGLKGGALRQGRKGKGRQGWDERGERGVITPITSSRTDSERQLNRQGTDRQTDCFTCNDCVTGLDNGGARC